MKDKSLEITLIAIFGLSGLTVTILAWFWPAMESERIMATLVGLTGLLMALFRYVGLRKTTRTENAEVPARVEVREKQ